MGARLGPDKPPDTVPDADVERTERWFLVTAALLATSFAIACVAQLGVGGASEADRLLDPYRVVWPQGWSFFTPVDQDVLMVYRMRADDVLVPVRERRFTDFLLGGVSGVSRRDDARSSELRTVALRVPESYWHECGRVVGDRCERPLTGPIYHADSPVAHPELCGTLAIAVERFDEAVPRHLEPLPRRVHRIVVVDLRCPS